MRFKKTTLKNGIRVVTEMHPESRAASLGIWILSGTRDETPEVAGISHFLEHLVFKATKTRSAFQIAKSLEELGGDLNAFTTREYTCYHALVLREHWPIALDVLCDLVQNMDLRKNDFELERSVILQEITMGDDNLEEMIYDLYFDRAYGKNPLGRPILGTAESIGRMTMQQARRRYQEHYSGPRLIVSASGDLDHEELVHAVETGLKRKKNSKARIKRERPRHRAFREAIEKPGEQLHLLMGLPVTSFRDPLRFEAFIVNALLGGGMTSKLYQSVRERKGLVYSIYSQLNTFTDGGLITLYAACEPKNMRAVMKAVQKEIRGLAERGIKRHEVELFKTQVKGSLLLGADDIENRMNSIAINEMVFGEYRGVDDIIARIDAVSVDSVERFMKQYYRPENFGVMLLGAGAAEMADELREYRLA